MMLVPIGIPGITRVNHRLPKLRVSRSTYWKVRVSISNNSLRTFWSRKIRCRESVSSSSIQFEIFSDESEFFLWERNKPSAPSTSDDALLANAFSGPFYLGSGKKRAWPRNVLAKSTRQVDVIIIISVSVFPATKNRSCQVKKFAILHLKGTSTLGLKIFLANITTVGSLIWKFRPSLDERKYSVLKIQINLIELGKSGTRNANEAWKQPLVGWHNGLMIYLDGCSP